MSFASPDIVRICAAHSNVGKTTLIERLVPLLAATGRHVGTIKHAHHGFEVDRPGTDSDRHARAGAVATVLLGPDSAAVLHHAPTIATLTGAAAQLAGCCDLILAEGFRDATGRAIVIDPSCDERLTVAADHVTIGARVDELTSDELTRLTTWITT